MKTFITLSKQIQLAEREPVSRGIQSFKDRAAIRCALLVLLALGLLGGIRRAQAQDPLVITPEGKVTVNGPLTATEEIDAKKGLKGLTATQISFILPIDKGGTGSSKQNFVDLTSDQPIAGTKTFTDNVVVKNTATIPTLQGTTSGGYSQPLLTMKGDVKFDGAMNCSQITGGINGEKPPLKFKITPASGNGWNTVLVDTKALCGDDDGCRIEVRMQKPSDSTSPRVVTAEVYMEQPTPGQTPGPIKGMSRMGTEEARWTLNVSGTNADLLSRWDDWLHITNTYNPQDNYYSEANILPTFHPPNFATWGSSAQQPYGPTQKQFSGSGNEYRIAFRFAPGISATVIIFDR